MRYIDPPDKPIDPMTDEDVPPPGASHYDLIAGRWIMGWELAEEPEVPDYPDDPKSPTDRERFDARMAAHDAGKHIREGPARSNDTEEPE